MRSYFFSHLVVLLLCSAQVGHAQDLTLLGGSLSSELPGRHAIQVAAPNITSRERFELQASGFAVFHKRVNGKEGLGPQFNNRSCGGCHVDNGRGPLLLSSEARGGSTFIVKLKSRRGLDRLERKQLKKVGEQLRDQRISGRARFHIRLAWKPISGKYPDGTRYQLRKPVLRFRIPGLPRRLLIPSMRMTPALIGPGLLEAVEPSSILEFSDPLDANGDGISGQVSYVTDRRSASIRVGRFGFKASHPTVEQQSAAAAFNDMGLTNVLFPGSGRDFELSEESLFQLTAYLQLAGVPRARDQDDPQVVSGKALFQQIGCDACHRLTLKTGAGVAPELDNQEIHPLTDLLLHDMGDGLADAKRDAKFFGREWRTSPLWGLGYSKTISSVRALFLHDGRARTIEEAVLWHGGEAETAQSIFQRLKLTERRDLLRFLESL